MKLKLGCLRHITNRLLAMDVALMSDEEKLEHANTMKCLKKKLFSDYN